MSFPDLNRRKRSLKEQTKALENCIVCGKPIYTEREGRVCDADYTEQNIIEYEWQDDL